MKRAEKEKIEKALNNYFKEIHKIYVAGDFRQENFYSSLKALIEQCSRFFPFQGRAGVLV